MHNDRKRSEQGLTCSGDTLLSRVKRDGSRWNQVQTLLMVLGPGLMVCLADSDIGGLSTMAVAGSTSSYALLPMQFALIPALYLVQELVVRLSLVRRQGVVMITREELGTPAACALTAAMCVVGFFAIISQFSGIVAAGELFGIPLIPSSAFAVVGLILIVLCNDYKHVEFVGLILGACLSVFIVAAVLCKPPWKEVALHMLEAPPLLSNANVRELAVANVGTVITPWMLFFQGSALVEKRLDVQALPAARVDTLVGSVITQLVMAAVLIVFAVGAPGIDFDKLSLAQVFIAPLKPIMGTFCVRILMAFGLLGSSLLATLVVSLGIAWNMTECWLGGTPSEGKSIGITSTAYFRYSFVITIAVAAATVIFLSSWTNIAQLNVAIQVLNGVLMPLVVGCVFCLATLKGVLPEEHRVRGVRALILGIIIAFCSALALLLAFGALWPQEPEPVRA